MPKESTSSKSNAAKPNVKKTQKSSSSDKGGVRVSNEAAAKLKGASDNKKQSDNKKSGKEKKDNSKTNKKEAKNSDKDDGKDEVKDGLNNATRMIGGSFNVSKALNQLKNLITKTLEFPDIGSIQAQFAYSAIAELFTLYVVRLSGKYNTKSAKNADLYEVSLENLVRGIRESKDFGPDVKSWAESFSSSDMNYVANFYDTEAVMVKFLEKKAFPNSSNLHISKDALNFICYILSRTLTNLTRIACLLSECGKKKKIRITHFLYASRIVFANNGELYNLIVQRLDEVKEKVKSIPKEDGEDGEGEAEDGEDADSDAEAESDSESKGKKGKGKGKSPKDAKKKDAKKKDTKKKDEEPDADKPDAEGSDAEDSDAEDSDAD
jgi:hypothetical protein